MWLGQALIRQQQAAPLKYTTASATKRCQPAATLPCPASLVHKLVVADLVGAVVQEGARLECPQPVLALLNLQQGEGRQGGRPLALVLA